VQIVTSVFPANAPFADQKTQIHLKNAQEAIDGAGFQGVGNWRAHIAQYNLGKIQCVSINVPDSPKPWALDHQRVGVSFVLLCHWCRVSVCMWRNAVLTLHKKIRRGRITSQAAADDAMNAMLRNLKLPEQEKVEVTYTTRYRHRHDPVHVWHKCAHVFTQHIAMLLRNSHMKGPIGRSWCTFRHGRNCKNTIRFWTSICSTIHSPMHISIRTLHCARAYKHSLMLYTPHVHTNRFECISISIHAHAYLTTKSHSKCVYILPMHFTCRSGEVFTTLKPLRPQAAFVRWASFPFSRISHPSTPPSF